MHMQNERRIALPRPIDDNQVSELRWRPPGLKLFSHPASNIVKSLTGLPSEYNENPLYLSKRYNAAANAAAARPNNRRIEENDEALLRQRRRILNTIETFGILSGPAAQPHSNSTSRGLPTAPRTSLLGTDSAILVAPSRAGKTTLANAIVRERSFSPAEFEAAYQKLLPPGTFGPPPRELQRPLITLVRIDNEDEAGRVPGQYLAGLVFKDIAPVEDINQWVDSVERTCSAYREKLQNIIDALDPNAAGGVQFRGPLLAVEENEASTTVPTVVTATSGDEGDLFTFVLEIPFISASDLRNYIRTLEEVYLPDDPAVTKRDPAEVARARDLFDLRTDREEEEEDMTPRVRRLRDGGWRLPGHWKFVIGHKLVWRFQPKSFQEGAEAVHDFALKVLHGPWSMWPIVDSSGVQLSVPSRIPALLDLPGIALDDSARDHMFPEYLRDFSANTYVFLVQRTGQMDGDVRHLAREKGFVRQALVLERERLLGREIDEVPPRLMFVAIFDRADCVRPHFTEQDILRRMGDENMFDRFKSILRRNLRDILHAADAADAAGGVGDEDDEDDEGDDIGRLIRRAEGSGAIQYQFVCTLRSNAGLDNMVGKLDENARHVYGLQNNMWLAWLRRCHDTLRVRQVLAQVLTRSAERDRLAGLLLRGFLGNRERSTQSMVEAIKGHLEPLQRQLDACLDDAKRLTTPGNLGIWQRERMLTENNSALLNGALRSLGENNKLISWLLTAINRKLSYHFYNGQLAEYRRLTWVRQLARDITNMILPKRAAGPAGDSSSVPQGGAGPSSGQPQASVGGPGHEDSSIMLWNKVYALVLHALIDGIHAGLSVITPHDLRVFGHQVAMLEEYFPTLARETLGRYRGLMYATRQRYTYMAQRARAMLVDDVADNMKGAFEDYLNAWADKAADDILRAITALQTQLGVNGGLGQNEQLEAMLQTLEQELFVLDGGRQANVVAPPRDEEPRPPRAPPQVMRAQQPRHINAEDLAALRRMTVEEWVEYPVEVCRQVLVDLRVCPEPEVMVRRCMQRKLLFKHLTEFLKRNEEPQDRNVRPRHE
eukprot:jgi/Mesvir1/4775/Mv20969-RA.2